MIANLLFSITLLTVGLVCARYVRGNIRTDVAALACIYPLVLVLLVTGLVWRAHYWQFTTSVGVLLGVSMALTLAGVGVTYFLLSGKSKLLK